MKTILIAILGAAFVFACAKETKAQSTNITVTLTKEQLDIIKNSSPATNSMEIAVTKRLEEAIKIAEIRKREEDIDKISTLLRKATPAKRKEVLDLLQTNIVAAP